MRSLLALAYLGATAYAEPALHTKYVEKPVPDHFAAAPSSNIIYLKRCPSSGCFVKFGPVDDSRTQTSSITNGDRNISAFAESDQVWNDMVDCVKTTYSPFNVTVTDVDPGNVPHYENIVGGKPEDLDPALAGMGVEGIAPINCGEVANGISYTFDVNSDPLMLCWVACQETAHMFGLDHEYYPPDPMTYQLGDLPKRFQDVDAPCGEDSQRACRCGRTSQNSYKMIVSFFGPGAPITPTVTISWPTDGKTVQPGFDVIAKADSIVKIDHVELYVDGALASTLMAEPYVFPTDASLVEGDHSIEIRAYDVQGTPGSASETVTMGPPCTASKGCTGVDVCLAGVCVLGPKASGGLGSECTEDSQCQSYLCVDGGEPSKHCGALCDPSAKGVCPSGFSCLASGSSGACYPNAESGCCEAGGSPRGAIALGAFAWVVILRRRRR